MQSNIYSTIQYSTSRLTRIWVTVLAVSLILLFLQCGGFSWRVLPETFTVGGRTIEGLFFARETPGRQSNDIVIAAHGTNSHREIFLPLAWECGRMGIPLFTFDSPTVTTDEGVEIRRRELEAAVEALCSRRNASFTFHLIGHSDGVPPILAFAAGMPASRLRSVSILGSFATPDAARAATPSVFAGAFDQVFPVSEIRASLAENGYPKAPFTISWLSDHFTEQYDPLLTSSIAGAITGITPSPAASVLPILLFVLISLSAAILGMCAASSSFLFRAVFIFFSLQMWYIGYYIEWTKGAAVIGMIGMLAGPLPLRAVATFVFIFWGLMAMNVAATAEWFRSNLSEALLWLPVAMLWYVVAWTVKLTLFLPSLIQRIGSPFYASLPTALLALAALSLLFPDLPGRVRRAFETSAPSAATARSRPLAIALVAVMAGLWTIRFFQGFVRLEILESMAGTYLRTLLLPTFWLLWMSISALRDPAGHEEAKKSSPDRKLAK